MADCRIKNRNRLQGCAATKIPQVENNRKLREIQRSEKQKSITRLKEQTKLQQKHAG